MLILWRKNPTPIQTLSYSRPQMTSLGHVIILFTISTLRNLLSLKALTFTPPFSRMFIVFIVHFPRVGCWDVSGTCTWPLSWLGCSWLGSGWVWLWVDHRHLRPVVSKFPLVSLFDHFSYPIGGFSLAGFGCPPEAIPGCFTGPELGIVYITCFRLHSWSLYNPIRVLLGRMWKRQHWGCWEFCWLLLIV
jgi:hypothetical protein